MFVKETNTLRKMCQNNGFFLPAYSRTEWKILPLLENKRVRGNPQYV